MATKTFEELKQMAIQIRDEKANKQNTATRIGTQMLEHLNKLEQDFLDKDTTEGKFSELQESSVSNSFFNKFVSDFFIDISNYNGDLPLSGNLYITRFGDDSGFKTITISNTPTYSIDTIVAQYYNKTEDTGFIETTSNGILIQANIISWPEREVLNSALIKPKAYFKNKTLNDYYFNKEIPVIKESVGNTNDKFSSIFSYETKNEAGNKPSDLIRYIRFIPSTKDKTKFKITRAQITRCSYFNGSPVCVVNYGVIDEDANPLKEVDKEVSSYSYNAEKREFTIELLSLTMIVGLNQDVPNASDMTWVWETNKYPCPINSPLFSLAENSVEKDYMYIKPNYNSQQVTDGYLDQNTGGITDLDGKNGCITNFVQIDKSKIQDGYVILCKESDRVCYYSSNTEESFISGKYFGSDINWNILVDEDIINNTNIEYFRTYMSNNYQVNIWYVKKEDIEAFKLGLFKIPGLYITVLDEMLADTKLRKDVDKLGIEPIAENLIDRTTLSLQKSYINPDTGTYDTSSGIYASQTSFKSINPGDTLFFNNVRSVAFYSSDSESAFISGVGYPTKDIKSPDNASYMRFSLYYNNYNDVSTYIVYGNTPVDMSKIKLTNVVDDIIVSKQIISLLQSDVTPKGKARTGDAIPEGLLFKDAFLAAENGTILGKENVAEGELLIYQGFENFDVVNKKIENATEVLNFDVVIIGCGSAGMGAAYALKNSGYKICLIDKLSALGGTATRAGITTWIEAANPSFFVDIFEELKEDGKATGDINASILPSMFRSGNTGGSGLVIDADALSEKYKSDMNTDSNITILLEHEFVSIAKSVNGVLESIYIRDKGTKEVKQINAKWFIDTSGDAVVCRSACPIVGVDYFYGRDARSVYNESIAPAVVSDTLLLNEPTQYFQVSSSAPSDGELLNTVNTVYRGGDTIYKPDYIYHDGYESSDGWVNGMNGMTWNEGGRINLQAGADNTAKVMKEKRALEYWKYIKLLAKLKQEKGESSFGGWNVNNVLSKNWTGNFTEYIGIRETFRIACDAMLTQNDLGKTILASDLQDYIAEGSHIIDFHVKDGLSIDELNKWNGEGSYEGNQLLRPYGIRYGSLIPKRLNNVWVAGRCSGMSQIAAASARVNKLCSQLGWAAGNAAKMALKKSLKNTREVSISELQSSTYTNFVQSITDMNELLDSKWKL